MSLVQARYESQRIQLESELAVQLEQRVTERLAQAQESSLRQAASLREHHRKQLQDLSGQHQQELASQLAQFKVEMAEREERQQQVAEDYELRSWSPECPFQAPAPFPWVEPKLGTVKSCSLD
uniref:cDNA FLJ58385, moderately similar to Centrobin n=1 Tax=Homo sapiens TaxID=9606 RepID=B4DZU1_HUMAN|nr:unnamed protein product [Homo sapiens]